MGGVKKRFALITGLGYAFVTDDADARRRLVNRLAMGLYRFALSGASGVFFQNPDDLALFEAHRLLPSGVPTTVVNGSGVDTDHFSVAPLPDRPSFLLIARLLVDKGVREFITAARLVKARYPDVTFSLVGPLESGPACISGEELNEWIRSGAISYLGELKDVRPAIAAARF